MRRAGIPLASGGTRPRRRAGWSLLKRAAVRGGHRPDVDPKMRDTFPEVANAVVPGTPDPAADPGPEREPGGLDEFMLPLVDGSHRGGLPHLGPAGTLPLVDRGAKDVPPGSNRRARLAGPDDRAPAVGSSCGTGFPGTGSFVGSLGVTGSPLRGGDVRTDDDVAVATTHESGSVRGVADETAKPSPE